MNILFYNNSFLWNNQSIVSLELAERFKKHKIFFLTCDRFLYSCAPNESKKKKICYTCQINKRKHFNILKNKIEYKEIVLKNISNYNNYNFEFNDFDQLKKIFYKNLPIGELVVSQLCDNEKSYTLTDEYIKANKNKILNNINSGINLFNETLSKIKQHKIEKIYAWNGRRASDGPVVYAAEYRNLPFKSFVSQEPKRYTLSRGTKIHDLKDIKRRINNFSKYISKKNINFEKSYRNYILNKITGLAGFGNYGYENFIKKNTLMKTNEKNFVIFFTSSSYENAGFSDWDSRIYLDQYQALEKIIKDQRLKNLKIFIRWHPLLKKAGLIEKKSVEKIININAPNVTHIQYDDYINSYNLLMKANKVITFGSTIVFEAYHFKKPIINLTQTPYDDLEFMYNPSSHDEVVDLIKSKINNKFSKLVPTYTYLVKKKFYNFKIKNYEINENEYYINNKLVINYSLFDRLRIFFSKFFYI